MSDASGLRSARYADLAQALRQRIVRGDWLPGSALPAEQVLAHDHAVALGTMRRALQLLTQEGLIERVHGRGTFVRAALPGASMLRFFRFGDEPGGSSGGQAPESRMLQVRAGTADATVAAALGLKVGAAVLQLERLRLQAGQARLVEHIWLPHDLFEALLSLDWSRSGALLYPVFAQHCRVHVHRAVDDVRFGVLPAEVAVRLALTAGHPGAVVQRKAFNLAGRCVEWRTTWGDAHAFRYTVSLT